MRRLLMMCILAMGVLLSSCEKEQNVVEERKIVLFSLEQYQIEYDGPEVFWKSDNIMIASVNQSGLVTAFTVGKTDILAGSSVYEVEVVPKYNTFIEPYRDWNAPREYFEEYMESKCGSGQKTENMSTYVDKSTNTVYTYMFDEYNNGESYIIQVPIIWIETFTYWLTERYFLLGEEDNIYTLLSPDKRTAVAYGVSKNGEILALMIPFTDDTRAIRDMRMEVKRLLN